MAGGAPVVIDTKAGTAVVLDPNSGEPRHTTELDLRPDDRIVVSGSSRAPQLYVVAARGLLSICDLTATSCGRAVPLAADNSEPGPAVEASDRLFIPDYRTGKVWVIDLRGARVVAQVQVLAPQTRFQLLNRDGVVFFNDPGSQHAGVIHLDGGIRKVVKYDPTSPGEGLSGGGTAPTAPPTAPGGGSPPVQPPNQQVAPPPPTRTAPPVVPRVNPPAATTAPPAAAPIVTTSPPAAAPTARIIASTGSPGVDQDVALSLATTGSARPVAAVWRFGDGQEATGLTATHRWGEVRTYSVTVRVSFDDGRTADAVESIRVQRVEQPRGSVSVRPNEGGTVTSQPAGINCPGTCTAEFPSGTAVTLTAAPQAAATFDRWAGACTGTASTCRVTVAAGQTQIVQVAFTVPPPPPVNLTVELRGKGFITGSSGFACPPTCTAEWPRGTVVTLTAKPSGGFVFAGWAGACAGAGATCTITMSAARSTTANFVAQPVLRLRLTTMGGPLRPGTARVDVSGAGGGQCNIDNCAFRFAPGTQITLRMVSLDDLEGRPGSWGGDCSGTALTCTLVMNDDKDVTASFSVAG